MENHIPPFLWLRNPYRNLKSANFQDYAQEPQRNLMFMNSASELSCLSFFSHPPKKIIASTSKDAFILQEETTQRRMFRQMTRRILCGFRSVLASRSPHLPRLWATSQVYRARICKLLRSRFQADVQIDDQANFVRISLCFGITVVTLAQTLGHVSRIQSQNFKTVKDHRNRK